MTETRFIRLGTLLVAAMTLAVFFTGTSRVPATSRLTERGITLPTRAIERITTLRQTMEKIKNPDQAVGKNWEIPGDIMPPKGQPEPIGDLKDIMPPVAHPAPNEFGEIEVPVSGPGSDPVNYVL